MEVSYFCLAFYFDFPIAKLSKFALSLACTLKKSFNLPQLLFFSHEEIISSMHLLKSSLFFEKIDLWLCDRIIFLIVLYDSINSSSIGLILYKQSGSKI